jgi:dTDP-glucose pyrophosphorylase
MNKIKTAIILCAGESKRFSENKLLKQLGKRKLTLPQYAVLFCIENGITNINITLNKNNIYINEIGKLIHPIIKSITDIIDPLNVNVNFKFQNENEYGTAAAIKCWQDKIKEDFIVLFGDNYYSGNLHYYTNYLKPYGIVSTIKKTVNPRNLQLAAIIDNYVIEKPHVFIEGEYFCGFMIFSKEIMLEKYCDKIQKSGRNEYEISDLFNSVENRYIIKNDLDWMDITYQFDIKKMEELIDF